MRMGQHPTGIGRDWRGGSHALRQPLSSISACDAARCTVTHINPLLAQTSVSASALIDLSTLNVLRTVFRKASTPPLAHAPLSLRFTMSQLSLAAIVTQICIDECVRIDVL